MPVEVIADHIKAISEGIRKLRSGPLNDKALLLLIQHAAPSVTRSNSKLPMSDIRAVLDGIESLEATYLRKRVKV